MRQRLGDAGEFEPERLVGAARGVVQLATWSRIDAKPRWRAQSMTAAFTALPAQALVNACLTRF